MQVIDAHCHFWRIARGDYGWLESGGAALAPIRRDFLPPDYPGAARLIVVQAAPSLAETDFLLSLAKGDSRIAGVVGWVDLGDPGAAGLLCERADNPALRGIRPMLQDIADPDWLETAVNPRALAALVRLGLRFDALVTARHLPMLARFAARRDDLPLVIDHAAKPQPDRGEDWERGMAALAAIPHVHCKLSGLLTELSPEELRDPLPALRPILARLLDWFGPERLIWGSDWPVVTLAASYDEWRDLTQALLADLSPSERAAIMGGNAARFYGLAA
ncbi:amidohydrolase [Paracoccus halophilus]|uniref:Amidohydrolase n=1 Tax=Paracoccus halophilus TaxID=376733 RepID=A0A099F330_9RHOB|nr:amidohydrolase family protein [Paracoccus halophilus]KGJ04646.1 amidohydrolase [Paracoccus halophilus]